MSRLSDYQRRKKYIIRRRKTGWTGYSIFGPVALVEAVKEFIRNWKADNYRLWQQKEEKE